MKPRTDKQKVLESGRKPGIRSFWFCILCFTLIQTVGQVTILAAPTVQDFDQPGTPYTLTWVYGVPASVAPDVIINRFDTASEVSQWRFDFFDGVTHSAVFDPAADANGNPASGAMKVTLGFNTALVFENQAAYTRDLFPGLDGSTFTSMQMDVRVDPASALDAGGNNGQFAMVVRNTGNYDWNVQFADNVRAADGWRHIMVSPLVGAVNDIRAITWQLYGGPSLNGPVTLWVDNVSFTSLGSGPTGNFLRLASQNYDTANTIEFDLTAPGRYSQVVAEFDFRMIPGDFSRADGLSFALLGTCISPAGSVALSEEPNAVGSFGVGFDIYQNEWDPNNNHVSLHFNGEEKAAFPFDITTLDLADGQFHHARVTIDFSSAGASVSVSLDGVFTPVANYFIAGMTPYESRVAFGARTGGEFAHHDLDNIRVDFNGPLPPLPPTPRLLGYWKFDEGSGALAHDSSGQGNDAPIYGASWGSTYFGPVLCFDGLDDYVDISGLPNLCQGTIEAWANRSLFGGENEIVSGILLVDFATSGGEFQIYVGEWLSSGVVLAPDTWYHLVATFDGSTWKVYVNGVLMNSLATSYFFNHPNKFIGQFHDFGPYNWNGCLADVRIYSEALSDDEVLSNFKAGRPLVPVPVDIRPGDCPNPLNTRGVGTFPVAVVGVPGFNLAAIDVSSVTLSGVSPQSFAMKDVTAPFSPFLGKQDCLRDCRKSGPDRMKDLILYFDSQTVVATLGTVTDGQCLVLPLTGYLTDGTPIIGEDVVLILNRK